MSKTVAEMIAEAEKQNLEQTAARSVANPNVLTTGGAVGALPDGTPIQNQAITYNANVPGDPRNQPSTMPTPPVAQPFVPEAVAGYTDASGVYHPPTTTKAPAGAAPMTVGGVYGEIDAAYAQQGANIQATQAPINEQQIRDQTLQKFQTQIDALTNYYAEVKRKRQNAEFVQGEGRLGSDAAIQSRRGLLGSTMGGAQTNTINAKNLEIQDSIAATVDSERVAAVQAILGKANADADAEIKAKQEAKTKGATDYIEFLKGAATRKEERLNSAIANVLQDEMEFDDKELKQLADQFGLDVKTFKSKIAENKTAAATKAAKDAPKLEVVDGVGYQRQEDGSYKAVTQKEAAKPIIIDGVGYDRQADGTLKAVTQKEAPKPINRVVGKVLQVSLDGGITWAPAKQASTPGVKPTGKNVPTKPVVVTPVNDTKKTEAAINDIVAGIGGGEFYNENGNKIAVGADGKLSPQDYLTIRNEYVKMGYNPTTFDTKLKGYRDPNNTEYAVGK